MNTREIKKLYLLKRKEIKSRLNSFHSVSEEKYWVELVFCLLTPQSNAQRCWIAAEEISKLKKIRKKSVVEILKTKTRFHNNKTKYVLKSRKEWKKIYMKIKELETISLRNWLAENVLGLGFKEASHFLRNIGKSDNKIAILDRHILKNLRQAGIIKDDKIKNKKHYVSIENKFREFSNSIKIPIDELDLLFWSKENGEIFK